MDNSKLNKSLIKFIRKAHIHIGLGLLFFIMLFGFSGLLLNHHWEFAKFWENRKEIQYEKSIEISGERNLEALVQEIVNKLGIDGSIINPRFQNDSSILSFIVAKPGTRYDVEANFTDGTTKIKEAKFNSWGTLRNLHVIRNPAPKESSDRYPSALASVWSISIDVVSIGLIVICLSGWYLCLRARKRKLYLGLVSLAGGFIICMYFLLF